MIHKTAFLLMSVSAVVAAAPGLANDVRFDQSSPTVRTLNIRQTGAGHTIHGFTAGSSMPDPTAGARLNGNFGTVSLTQTSSADGSVALRVDASPEAESNIDVSLTGSGRHSVLLDSVSHALTSKVTVGGAEDKTVAVTVNAPGKAVSHDITLTGSAMTLTARQNATAALDVNLEALGAGASATITQSGEGSAANILGTIDAGGALLFNQTAVGSTYTLDVALAPAATLNFNQIAGGGLPASAKVSVPVGLTVTMTR